MDATEGSAAPSTSGSEVLHVPKAVFIEDVGAYLEGVIAQAMTRLVRSCKLECLDITELLMHMMDFLLANDSLC